MEPYSAEYHEIQREGGLRSARVVAPLVYELVRPRSVVDVGCGTAQWLKVFGELGIESLLGIEQPGFEPPEYVVETVELHDLRRPFALARRFDLGICLEVAEHLPPERGESFVEDLVALAPCVLFSAAVPNQANPEENGHINERWQSYWAELFATRGYEPIDCVRPLVWQDERVESWYAQNTVLYAAPDRLGHELRERLEGARIKHFPMDVVHPGMEPISVDVAEYRRELERRERKRLREKVQALRGKLRAAHSV